MYNPCNIITPRFNISKKAEHPSFKSRKAKSKSNTKQFGPLCCYYSSSFSFVFRLSSSLCSQLKVCSVSLSLLNTLNSFMDLIPGLPEEVGLECLVRVPYTHFSSASSVCRRWNAEIRQLEFWRLRKVSGLTQPLVVMVQSRVNPSEPRSDTMKHFVNTMIYRLTVFEPETGEWRELPPVQKVPLDGASSLQKKFA